MALLQYMVIVLKQVLATPGYLSSVYKVLTIFMPCFTNSIPSTVGFYYVLYPPPVATDDVPPVLPNLSILSLSNYSSILYLAYKNSYFSLFCTSNAIFFYYSSIFLFTSDISLAPLILYFSLSSLSLFSSSALFFLIDSCSSFAFFSFSSFDNVLFGPDDSDFL